MSLQGYKTLAGCLVVLAPGLASAQDSDRDARNPQIAVRLYDYARLPDHLLSGAEREARRILRKAGVATSWVRCPLPGQAASGDPECDTSLTLTDFVLSILPREMAERLTRDHNVFGVAASSANGYATHARVFYHRVEELSERKHASRALLLGHLLAHELGHLLLGIHSHSNSGIMRVPWTRDQLQQAHHARLGFIDSEVRRIQDQLRRRTLALTPSDLALKQSGSRRNLEPTIP